jgi:hypothetical protein
MVGSGNFLEWIKIKDRASAYQEGKYYFPPGEGCISRKGED